MSVKKSANDTNESAIVLFHRVEGVVFAPATLNTYVPSEHSIGVNKGGGCQGGAATLLTAQSPTFKNHGIDQLIQKKIHDNKQHLNNEIAPLKTNLGFKLTYHSFGFN